MNSEDMITALALAIDRARADIIRGTRHDHGQRADMLTGTRRVAGAIVATLGRRGVNHDGRQAFYHNATQGPAVRVALNDEALARGVGPGSHTLD